MRDDKMGSQTLEILRQGVWASLTGGWFYDPHQDIFCNTFHLYIWLFLLCFPFTIYVYFPPKTGIWYIYCIIVAGLIAIIKLLNYALHRMYDTTECIKEEAEDELDPQKREEEGIELQVLSNKSVEENLNTAKPPSSLLSYAEGGAVQSTDADSMESIELLHLDTGDAEKLPGTIDLKAEVHRKNSSESSEDQLYLAALTAETLALKKRNEKGNGGNHQRSKTDSYVNIYVQQERQSGFQKRSSKEDGDELVEPAETSYTQKTFVNIESEAGPSRSDCRRRHSNFTNSTLNIHPPIAQEIKATGSLELGLIDKNPNPELPSDEYYFQSHNSIGVRRIRSTALETSCPAPSLTVHPNSLEIIGCKSRNPLPPPSTTLIRNQHLNLCPYYGSEIVYPIAEQSDEHQTSQGADSDRDSAARNSDSDYEECGRERSPYLYLKLGKLKKPVPYKIRYPKSREIDDDNELASSNSKDMLLKEEPSVVEVQVDDQMNNIECIIVSEDTVDKRSSDSASITSLECREIVVQKPPKSKMKSSHKNVVKDNEDGNYECKHQLKKKKKRNEGSMFYDTESGEAGNSKLDSIPCGESSNSEAGNRSSLKHLDLDWLFGEDSENQETTKTDNWANSSTISLEQDVSKVLQETVSTKSLGAIPKKSRGLPTSHSNDNSGRKTPKSESDKCSKCRSKMDVEAGPSCSRERGRHSRDTRPDSVERVECYVLPASGLRTINFVPRRESRQLRSTFEDSSSSTSRINELSTLLPSTPLLSAFLASRRDIPLALCLPTEKLRLEHAPQALKRRRMSKSRGSRARRGISERRRSQSTSQQSGDPADEAEIQNVPTENNSEKAANRRCCVPPSTNTPGNVDIWDGTSFDSAEKDTAMREASSSKNGMCLDEIERRQRVQIVNRFTDSLRRRILNESNSDTIIINTSTFLNEENFNTPAPTFKFIRDDVSYPKVKSYYKFKILPKLFVRVAFDRLKLLALLDRNLTLSETVISILLSVFVSLVGALLLYLDLYKDIPAFIFCFVMASCQYSLLKSVQPDAASPMHGFNRIISYSRPIYFCMCSMLILSIHYYLSSTNNIPIHTEMVLTFSKNFLAMFILFFPLWFSLGLFPQIDTFVMYFLEQIDMHIFGGNAMSSLLGSLYCIFRSVMVVLILVGPAYGGLCEKKGSQHTSYSIFCAAIVASSYHLSRCTSDPSNIWNIVKKHVWPPDIYREHSKFSESGRKDSQKKADKKEAGQVKESLEKSKEKASEKTDDKNEHVDPLPKKLQATVNGRLKNDIIICTLISIFTFGIHSSTVFTVLQPELSPVLWSVAAGLGLALHYIIPQLRKQLPWTCIARPVLRSFEYGLYEIKGPSRIMWFEKVYVFLCFVERNIIYPLLFITALTEDGPKIEAKTGPLLASFIVVICGLKCLRSSYSNQNIQYLVVTFTALAFKCDYKEYLNNFLVTYFFMSIIYLKIHELLLKVQFVVTYIAPWQITWGSAFHAFAQPFSVPHSAMLFLQAIISAILSTPLNPFLGSAIFLTSYVRPVKFWERNYNTRRVDHSNTPLSSHLESMSVTVGELTENVSISSNNFYRNLGADDNNLNSIFYEHLTRSLQHSLCGDLALGRWGLVNQGDCFVLASDYLNCLVHIIEVGNGLVTFQVRGLEFRGTYCQQREVEAITEGVEENDGCCCCDTGHLPNMLSVNAAFSQRWLAWEVTAAKYVLEGYSISDNSAISMFQVFEFRRVLVSYYVKSIIYYTIKSPKLEEWLNSQTIMDSLKPMQDKQFVDLDPVFNFNIDEDFDINKSGMTMPWFLMAHGEWITFCVEKFGKTVDSSRESPLVLLCFALGLLGRRALGAVSHNTQSSVEFFLYGLHALFKGDFRITCARDEWVFTDIDLLKAVVAPGIRMSLKLHQDHFMSPDEYEELPALFEAITKHQEELVISHEGDPAWRNAVLSGTPSLLALRHVLDDGTDEYKIIMLNKRYLSFRVIKINRECVRGLWAGQQQELIYLRNRNPERGSIQNAKQALRNIINSSCDQPIGYPIYVSPLTTSYADTNDQFCSLVGGSVTLQKIQNSLLNLFRRIRKRCGEGCSSGASRDEIGMGNEGVYAMTPVTTLGHHNSGGQSCEAAHLSGSIGRGSSLGRASLGANRGSLVSMGKPTSSTLANLAGIFKEKDERAVSQAPDGQARPDERYNECESPEKDAIQKVMIIDPNLVYDGINLGRRIDVLWPTEYMRIRGGRSYWNNWIPETGMEGFVVHKWTPNHRDPSRRSHVDRTILLVQIEDKFIPIAEQGVKEVQVEP